MNQWWLVAVLFVLLMLAIIVAIYPFRRPFKLFKVLTALMLIIGSTLMYWQWGSWKSLEKYTRQQATQQQVQAVMKSLKSPQDLVDKLKHHLESNPDSARGWFLLGRLYASQGQWPAAYDAFSQAHRLAPNDEQITVNYAQSTWQTHHQTFDPSIRRLFQSILNKNPNQPDALSMLAIDAFQVHAYQKAIGYWTHLLSLVPQDSVDAKAIRRAIAQAQKVAKVTPAK